MVRYSEGTATNPLTKANGYDVIVRGLLLDSNGKIVRNAKGSPMLGPNEVFTDFSTHPFANGRPAKTINTSGLLSTASGGYQILLPIWKYYSKSLHLANFSPAAQDLIAVQLLRERKALPYIENGDFAVAVQLASSAWASLPGANYPGQNMQEIGALRAVYASAGGTLKIAT